MSEADWEPCCGGEHYFTEFLDDPDNTTILHPAILALEQDALDGIALRRLRDALPHDVLAYHDEIAFRLVWSQGTGEWYVSCSGQSGDGDSLAEAADKCREALAW
jgi:hypothetical protein